MRRRSLSVDPSPPLAPLSHPPLPPPGRGGRAANAGKPFESNHRPTPARERPLRLFEVTEVAVLLLWLIAPALASADEIELLPFEPPELEHLEAAVADQLRASAELLESVLAEPEVSRETLGEAFGEAGRFYHAYEMDAPAAVCYDNAASLVPGDFRWRYYLAVLDHQAGRLDAAITGYERSLELVPASLPARVRLGDAYLAAQRPTDARAAYTQALELKPGTAAALAGLGQVALSEKRYADAVERLTAALALVPEADRLNHPLGLAYRGLGDMDKAREHLARRGKVGVKAADPLIDELAALKTGERVLLLRGQTAYRAGRFEEAAVAFQAALAAEPESVRARVNLASALAGAGRRDAAVAMFREVLELEPDNRATRFNLGVLLAQAGDAAGAVEVLTGAVELDPGDVEARLELARGLRRVGRAEEALDQASRAARLDPARSDARLLEAQTLVHLGRYGEARKRLEAAHGVMPEAGNIAAALAKMLAAGPDLAQRDGARALDLALRVYQATGDVRHAETVALALAESGRCDDAADWQRRAVEAARQGGAETLAGSLAATLVLLERRPCRMPGVG